MELCLARQRDFLEKSDKNIVSEAGRPLTETESAGNVDCVPSDRTRDRGAGCPEGGGCEASRSRQVEGSGRPVARGDQAEIPVFVRPLGTSFLPSAVVLQTAGGLWSADTTSVVSTDKTKHRCRNPMAVLWCAFDSNASAAYSLVCRDNLHKEKIWRVPESLRCVLQRSHCPTWRSSSFRG